MTGVEKYGCGHVIVSADDVIAAANGPARKWVGDAERWSEALTVGSRLFWSTSVQPMLSNQGHIRDVSLDLQSPGGDLPILLFGTMVDGSLDAIIVPFAQRKQFARALAESAAQLSRQRAEAENLERLESFRHDFINLLSHEAATPLTPLKLRIAVLARKLPADYASEFEKLQADIGRLEDFHSNLVAAARATSDNAIATMAPIDLAMVAEAVVRKWRAKHDNRAVSFSGRQGIVFADGERVAQCLEQLLNNAAKHAGRGANIKVDASAPVLSISDDGYGADEGQLNLLGMAFTKGHDSEATRLGAGLGLFIVRTLMQKMEGSASWSNQPGGGFDVQLSFKVP